MIEPNAIQFLIGHGFDLNEHFLKGIEYHKGNDKLSAQDTNHKEYIRDLINQLALAEIPIVLHNGFIDLIFLYENFYAKSPENLMKFTADLRDIFKGEFTTQSTLLIFLIDLTLLFWNIFTTFRKI